MDYGVIVDVETTGLDPTTSDIIEIGLLEFSVDKNYSPKLLSTYSSLQETDCEISPEITRITGIDARMIKNHSINWSLVSNAFSKASVVIAHNMAFDRAFLERIDVLSALNCHWACSLKHINWSSHGFKTRALNYLASDHGFVNPFSHRALFDCATTFRLITPYLEELITKSYETEYEFAAVGAPFEKKDILRKNGYQWDPKKRVWFKVVYESETARERLFLANEIYGGKSAHKEKQLITKI